MSTLDPTVQVAIIGGGFGLVSLVVGELFRRQNKVIQGVRDQVQNSHETNLRDDVDRVLEGMDRLIEGQERHNDDLRQHGREIGGLRAEIRHEREERLAADQRIDRVIERLLP